MNLIGDDNLVSNTKVSGSVGTGIFLRSEDDQITDSQSTGNGGFGASVACGGTIVRLSTSKNTGGALETITTLGQCTQLNNVLN